MDLDLDRVWDNVQKATTEDLLDRVTVYRAGMEPSALGVIEAELRGRGVTAEHIERHAGERRTVALTWPDGTARPCSFCDRPAVAAGWGWHRWWGKLPVFPRRFHYCEKHRSAEGVPAEGGGGKS